MSEELTRVDKGPVGTFKEDLAAGQRMITRKIINESVLGERNAKTRENVERIWVNLPRLDEGKNIIPLMSFPLMSSLPYAQKSKTRHFTIQDCEKDHIG